MKIVLCLSADKLAKGCFSRSLVNKQGHGEEVWLAQGCLDPNHGLLGTLVPVCSASVFSFLSLTLLVWKQKCVSQTLI